MISTTVSASGLDRGQRAALKRQSLRGRARQRKAMGKYGGPTPTSNAAPPSPPQQAPPKHLRMPKSHLQRQRRELLPHRFRLRRERQSLEHVGGALEVAVLGVVRKARGREGGRRGEGLGFGALHAKAVRGLLLLTISKPTEQKGTW